MKSFVGLLNKERYRYLSIGVVLVALFLLVISFGPIYIESRFMDTSEDQARIIITLISIAIISIVSIVLFFVSLVKDLKQKELFLHSPHSITTLIFSKYLYQMIQMLVISFIVSLAFFFVGDEVQGTFGQIFNLCLVMPFVAFISYIFFSILILFFYAFKIQLKKYIGKWSIVGTFIGVLVVIKMIDIMPDFTIRYGAISGEWIQNHLPHTTGDLTIALYDVYIADDLVYYAFFAILFVLSCKWIERVMTR